MDLAAYQRIRDDLLTRITTILDADPRVVAAWLSGSFGRGVADAWSDFDLHVAIVDESYESFLTDRPALDRKVAAPLLIQPEKPSNAMPGSSFQLVIYPGPVEVDWNIGPLRQAMRVPETTLLFERQPVPVEVPPPPSADERRAMAQDRLIFFWAMAPIAIKYAGRGDTRSAVDQIDLLTNTFITLWRLLELPDGPHPAAPHQNRATEPALDAILPHLGWSITPMDALEVIRQLCAAVERWHPALAAIGIAPPHALANEVNRLADLAAIEIAASPPAGSTVSCRRRGGRRRARARRGRSPR
jgi:predicted nucleotidyltransferase